MLPALLEFESDLLEQSQVDDGSLIVYNLKLQTFKYHVNVSFFWLLAEALAGGFVTSLPQSHGVTGAHGVSHHATFDRVDWSIDRGIAVHSTRSSATRSAPWLKDLSSRDLRTYSLVALVTCGFVSLMLSSYDTFFNVFWLVSVPFLAVGTPIWPVLSSRELHAWNPRAQVACQRTLEAQQNGEPLICDKKPKILSIQQKML